MNWDYRREATLRALSGELLSSRAGELLTRRSRTMLMPRNLPRESRDLCTGLEHPNWANVLSASPPQRPFNYMQRGTRGTGSVKRRPTHVRPGPSSPPHGRCAPVLHHSRRSGTTKRSPRRLCAEDCAKQTKAVQAQTHRSCSEASISFVGGPSGEE